MFKTFVFLLSGTRLILLYTEHSRDVSSENHKKVSTDVIFREFGPTVFSSQRTWTVNSQSTRSDHKKPINLLKPEFYI